MPIDRGPWNALIDDDGSNEVGTVYGKEDIKTVLLDPIDALVGSLGARIDHPYSSGYFGAEAGLWTVEAADQITYCYSILGKLVTIGIYLAGTELSGATTAAFRIYLPVAPPLVITKSLKGYLAYYGTAAGAANGVVEMAAGTGYLRLLRDIAGTPWPISTNYALAINASFWID